MIDINPSINDKTVKKNKSNLYATGKRKNSIAKVWLIPNGNGEIKVNKKDLNKYFSRPLLNMIIKKPFETINSNNFNANVSVKGGGLSGQAGAIMHGIARGLIQFEPDLKPAFKK